MTKLSRITFLVFLNSFLIGFIAHAQQVSTSIKITGIKSAKGNIAIGVFKDQASFEKEKSFKNFIFDKKALVNGNLNVVIKLEPGTYGLTLLDDENTNNKMEKNMIGLPKEGFGFSNFFLEKLKRPLFNDFKVNLNNNQNKVEIKVKYM